MYESERENDYERDMAREQDVRMCARVHVFVCLCMRMRVSVSVRLRMRACLCMFKCPCESSYDWKSMI